MPMSSCKACDEPLVLCLEPEDVDVDQGGSNSQTVPDDLELQCGCHFHWQCLLDQSSDVALSLKCPSCDASLLVNKTGPSTTNHYLPTPPGAVIPVKYSNEGGVQEDLDILPDITEEAYLETHPEARPARALQVMCGEGDVGGVIELLRDVSEEINDLTSFVRYQDPLADMKGALHLAIEKSQEETAWLLLWLSSVLPSEAFPPQARQVAESTGVGRLSVTPEQDIRTLTDGQGRTAADLAREIGGPWSIMLEAGIL